MDTITKAELAKTISLNIKANDNILKKLEEEKETAVDPFVSTSEIFYNRGQKRGLLNIAEKYELDLEF
jgi:hypothetical protein